jgi:hypothetical protein
MGLDMYAFSVLKEDAIDDFTIRSEEEGRVESNEEIQYWRKHHDLHGWMEQLYRRKGGDKESFNCVAVRLTEQDLDALQTDLLNSALPQTTGFFFGNNPPDMDSLAEDLKFVQRARDAIADGRAVYYDSWW